MKYFLFILGLVALVSCQTEETQSETTTLPKEEESLIEIDGDRYKEYYEGKKQVKISGSLDKDGERHGIWKFFTQTGLEMTVTEYKHGKKDGFSVVRYPNGALNYRGEFRNDKPVGIWTIYDEKTGKVKTEQDYGYPEDSEN